MKEELQELLDDLKTWHFWHTLLMMALGCAIFGAVVNAILVPQNYFAGGATGLALLIYAITDQFSLGMLYTLINIPIFIVGYREFSLRYIVVSLVGMVIYSVALEWVQVPIKMEDPMLAAILAGVLSGIGSGIYLRLGGSVGGMDILGTVLKKRFAIPIGTTFNVVNIVIITTNAVLYNLDIALYTGIYMYVFSWSMQRVLTGFSQRKSVFIITDHPEEVLHQAIRKIDRGATFFMAEGSQSHAPKRVVYTVINLLELGRLKQHLFETDPNAFVVVNDTAEVIGTRFLTWEDEGFKRRSRVPESR
jgi:uncharacterized membrane-anchored protein YitT (DUF2179 family)